MVLFTVICLSLSAQEKTVRRSSANSKRGIKEIFYVLKSNKKMKHGEYRMLTTSGKLKAKGQYENGKKAGPWAFYDYEGDIEQIYDYSTGVLDFNAEDDEPTQYFLDEGSGYKEFKPDRPPVFISGGSNMFFATGSQLKYPVQATRMGIQGTVFIEVFVTPDGRLIGERVKKGIGAGCDMEALRMIKLVPDNWLPALYKGKPVLTRFDIQVRFKLR